MSDITSLISNYLDDIQPLVNIIMEYLTHCEICFKNKEVLNDIYCNECIYKLRLYNAGFDYIR
jgi:hypothetical protein